MGIDGVVKQRWQKFIGHSFQNILKKRLEAFVSMRIVCYIPALQLVWTQ